MLPILLDFKFIKIYTFGVFAVLGFFWGMFLLWKLIKLTSYKEAEIFDGLFLSILAGMFLGRIFYVLFNFESFGFNILKFILINGYPGFSIFGALIGGFFLLFIFFRLRNHSFLQTIDYFIPGFFLTMAFGKIGAFLAGSEPGTTTRFFLKIIYSGFDRHRHLTALYEAGLFLIGVYFAYKILFWIRRGRLPHGFVWYFFWAYFGFIYLLLDNLKANHLYLVGFSFNLFFATVLVFVFGLYFFIFFRKDLWRLFETLAIAIFLYVKSTFKTKTRQLHEKTDRG